jgi:TIR domain
MRRRCPTDRIAQCIRKALCDGDVVEIDGLGTLRPASKGFEFIPEMRPRIFIAYVQEDLNYARRLFFDLREAGYQPWLDKENLLPGQNWPRSIDRAIEVSDFFIPCFSKRSVLKRSVFQSELRFALDCASRLPLDDVFMIPVRLDDCVLPARISRCLQHVNLFPDWADGIAQIRQTIDEDVLRKRLAEMAKAS